jgi:hypothetical protein
MPSSSPLVSQKKKQYTVNEVFELSYPRSLEQIKSGHIQNIIKALALLEELIQNLKSIYADGQIDNSNQMTRMKKRQPKKSKFDPDYWITDIVWSSEDNRMVNGGGDDDDEE